MTHNFFDNFEGADIERLNDCIKAVHAAGLKLDKYAQAGVNQGSGNVWICSEDWAGCVYCSIGFDVAWSWSCPNCGEEFKFDTYAAMSDFADEMNQTTDHEGCVKCCDIDEPEAE